jgi:hypothetical protein
VKRHDIDLLSLFFGLAFLGLASTGLFRSIDFALFRSQWVWPVLLIVAGAAVLASTVRSDRSEDATVDPEGSPDGLLDSGPIDNPIDR